MTSMHHLKLTITDPLVLYRSRVAQGLLYPDPCQHRAALRLQQVYHRLLDYHPPLDYRRRVLGPQASRGSVLRGPECRTTDLVLRPRDYEKARQINSPQGLLLHGEVGTGKSLLLDLLAETLPTSKKCRWHFGPFMLHVLAQLERLARRDEYSLLVLARDLVDTTPIVFLDEFQMPDRASSKLLSHLLTIFFHLGGVLIASSNRLPEELLLSSGRSLSRDPFLGVLTARCEVWDMGSARDWRRGALQHYTVGNNDQHYTRIPIDKLAAPTQPSIVNYKQPHHFVEVQPSTTNTRTPTYFGQVRSTSEAGFDKISPKKTDGKISWTSTTIPVYGRKLVVPRCHDQSCDWTFAELCGQALGPADYISLASRFHTFHLRDVPILTFSLRNEARRFISLLDALYEARCRLAVEAAADPDCIFSLDNHPPEYPAHKYPSNSRQPEYSANNDQADKYPSDNRQPKYPDEHSLHAETFAEIYQDQTQPFRPNVSTYASSTQTDEDSDFRPVDFSDTAAFAGEDERFAYRRASSRLWEMCSARWWAKEDWWRPMDESTRLWERARPSPVRLGFEAADCTSPFRVLAEPPPRFSWTHIWGMMTWGKKAGVWGQGAAARRPRVPP